MFGILKKALFLILLAKTFANFAFDMLSVEKIYPSPQVCFTILREKKGLFCSPPITFFFLQKMEFTFSLFNFSLFFILSEDNWTNELKSKYWVKAFWNGLIVCFLSILKFFFTSVFASQRSIMQEISEFLKKVAGGSLSKLNWQ